MWCNQVLDQNHNSLHCYQDIQPTNSHHNPATNEHYPHNPTPNTTDHHQRPTDKTRPTYYNDNDHNDATSHWPNIFLQSDGGCRYKGYSSTGWRIMAKSEGQETRIIAEGGTLHSGDRCSFTIECMALDEALEYLIKLCEDPRPSPNPVVEPPPPIPP